MSFAWQIKTDDVMAIVVGNRFGEANSNPDGDVLSFTSH